MARSMLRQMTQVSGSLAGAGYDDTLTLGVQATAEAGAHLEEDLNYIRSQIKNIIVKDNWYDLPRDITETISGTATHEELATAQAIVEYIATVSGADAPEHNNLDGLQGGNGVDEFYHMTGYTFSGISSDGTTMTINQAFNVDGNATFDTNVEVAGNTYFGGNVTVTGTFGFDDAGGPFTTVTGISTLMDPTGDDDTLLTEKAIYDWVNTVSGAITSSDTFEALEDTPVGYHEDQVIYYTATGVSGSSNFTFDPDTDDFNVGAAGSARLAIDSDSESTLYGDADTYITVSGAGAGFVEGGTLEFSVTSDGVMLNSGARVDEILDSTDAPTHIGSTSTDAQLATAKLIYDFVITVSGGILHNNRPDLQGGNGSDEYYHLTSDEEGQISAPDATTFILSNDLHIGDSLYVGDNVTVTGTFGFDGDTTVDEIVDTGDVTGIGPSSTDDQLATAKAIYDWTITLSGSLDDFLDLNDTPSTYAGSTGYILTVNDAGTAVEFSATLDHNTDLSGLQGGAVGQYFHLDGNTYSGISSDGTTMTISQAFNVDGNATFDANVEVAGNTYFGGDVTVTGTFGFDDGDTTVTGIHTVIGEPGSDDALVTEKAIVDFIDAEGIWEQVSSPYNRIQPKAAYWTDVMYHPGDAVIGGDLTVTGTLFYADVETVQVADNIMELNYGEPGSGVTKGTAGISIDRGGFPYYMFIFDEPTDTFRVGVSGTQDPHNTRPMQPVATREDDPLDHRVTWWDDDYNTLRTQGDTYITVNSGTDTIDFAVNNTTEFSVVASGINVKNSIATVNEFLNTIDGDSISAASTDAQLATAKLIYNYVDAMDHDEDLNGLNGGDGTDYWHVTDNTFSGISSDGTTMTIYDTAADINGTLNVDGATTLMSTLDVSGAADFYSNVNVSGTFGFDDDVNGSVDEILNSVDDTLDASSTDDQLATAKLIWTTISGQLDTKDEFIELDDTPVAYTPADGGKLVRVNDTSDAVIFETGLTYSGNNFVVAGPTTFESTINVEGDAIFDVDVEVAGNTYFGGDVTVTGTFGFDGVGQTTVSGIVTTITSGSNDNEIPTAEAVYELIDSLDPHTHYEFDLAKGAGNDWVIDDAAVADLDVNNLDVYMNGLLNRAHADYYTTAIVGTELTVTFSYNTYAVDWGFVKFLKVDV